MDPGVTALLHRVPGGGSRDLPWPFRHPFSKGCMGIGTYHTGPALVTSAGHCHLSALRSSLDALSYTQPGSQVLLCSQSCTTLQTPGRAGPAVPTL